MPFNCSECYKTVENTIGSCFEKLGCLIGRHPWKFIIVIILLNGFLGVGITWLKTDIDVSRVYNPVNSQAVQDEDKLLKIFPDKSGSDFYSHQLILYERSVRVILEPVNGTIFNIDFLDRVRVFDSFVRNIQGNKDGTMVIYSDICALRNNECVVSGHLFLTDKFQNAVLNKNVSYPYFILTSGEYVRYSSLISGAVHNSGLLTEATHLQLKYHLRSDTRSLIEASKAWQDELVKNLKNYSDETFHFAFSHADSLSEELNANIGGDVKLFVLTFVFMITFACWTTNPVKHNCIGSRMHLGFAGVMAAGMSVIASYGLVSACGLDYVSIVGTVPFLIIGVGVDDMFILLSGLSNVPSDLNCEKRIGQMLRTSGVAITITSLTDVLAFGAGALSSFKSVRNFCVFTGVAVIFCYLNQTLFFSACVAIDEDRVNAHRHVICCHKTKSKDEMQKENKSKFEICCCAGSKPKTREDTEGCTERLSRKTLAKILLLMPVKIIVFLVFVAYLVLAIWGALSLEQGLVVKNLLPPDSYFFKFISWEEEYFKGGIPISFVIDQNYDFSKWKSQSELENLISLAKADDYISADIEISWLKNYRESVDYYDNSSEVAFVDGLKSFLNLPQNWRFKNDVVVSGNTIAASRVYVFTRHIDSTQDKGQMMINMRDIASKSPLSVTAYSPPFIFYEQYIAVLPQTLQTLGIAVVAIFLITAIFMPHPLLLLYVVITMTMIMIGVVGFMALWNLTLSSITMIHLIMSIGFSVDFTVHVCHAYMVSTGGNRNQCVVAAINTSGGPIFNGAISSILGILVLAFAKSYIFMSFFRVMFLVIVLGTFHALIFLPVLLSLIGPSKEGGATQGQDIETVDETRDADQVMNEKTDLLHNRGLEMSVLADDNQDESTKEL